MTVMDPGPAPTSGRSDARSRPVSGALPGGYRRPEKAFLLIWCAFFITALVPHGGAFNRLALTALFFSGLAVFASEKDHSLRRIQKIVIYGLLTYAAANFIAVLIPSEVMGNDFSTRGNGPFYSVVLALSVIWGCRSNRFLRLLLLAMLSIFGSFFAVKLVSIPWLAGQFAGGRYTGNIGHHPNLLAGVFVILIPMLAGASLLHNRRSMKMALMAGSSVVLVLLFLTQSRFALLVLCVVVAPLGVSLFPTSLPKKNRVVIVLVVVLVIVPAGVGLWQHFASEDRRSLTGVYGRFETWNTALALSVDGPVFRSLIGHGNFKGGYLKLAKHYGRESIARPGEPVHAHNIYLQTLDESGILGFLALFVPWFMVIHGLARRLLSGGEGSGSLTTVFLVAMLTISAAGFFDHTFYRLSGKLVFGVFGMSTALLAVSKNRMVTTVRGHQGSAL